jgi:tRNA-specific 2-thiouridylase
VKNKKTVFVGLSGGVDSAVSAALLKEAGYEVVGVFIRAWHPEFLSCDEGEERRDAMRVAAHLDIPFLTFNFEKEYKKAVVDYMIAEYKAGQTPNPDVMCNKEIKFGAFLKKAMEMGADFVATGHYAQISGKGRTLRIQKGLALRRNLLRGIDLAKDQSYFLWTLTQKQLARTIFPVGHLKKEKVRKLAEKFKLPVAEKKDSQGICFLGKVDLKNFLKHYLKEKKGKVLLAPGGERSDLENSKRSDLKEPETIGQHPGAVFFTLGERRGFNITKKNPADKPYYVVGKDVKKNILYVFPDKNSKNFPAFALGDKRTGDPRLPKFLNFCLELEKINWISHSPRKGKKYSAQIRYHGELLPCQIKPLEAKKAKIFFEKPILAAPGQSCVIYDKEICLGGGMIL